MSERLTPLEASLLALDTVRNPSSACSLMICNGDPDAFVDERVLALIAERIAYAPRYRQRVSQPVGGLVGAFWVDDDSFDLDYHVQRLTLPAPAGMTELLELTAELLGRRLNHTRPLWEAYVIEGVQGGQVDGGRFAVLVKTHLSLVDGLATVDLAQVLLDDEADPAPGAPDGWRPAPQPSPSELLAGSLVRGVQDPAYAADSLRVAVTGAIGAAIALGEATGGLSAAVGEFAEEALRGGPRSVASPLAGPSSADPQLATAVIDLADLQTVGRRQQVSVHDVALAVVTGALRGWLLGRGSILSSGRVLTAVVPMAETDDAGLSAVGCQVECRRWRLPVGEPSALVRLQLLSHRTRAWRSTGRAVGARVLSETAGFAPATLHSLGRRALGDDDRGGHDLVITAVPGSQQPLYLAGSEVVASYPVLPLPAGQLLTVGMTSYRGQLFVGLSGDRDGPDLEVLVAGLDAAVAELLGARVRPGRGQRR